MQLPSESALEHGDCYWQWVSQPLASRQTERLADRETECVAAAGGAEISEEVNGMENQTDRSSCPWSKDSLSHRGHCVYVCVSGSMCVFVFGVCINRVWLLSTPSV